VFFFEAKRLIDVLLPEDVVQSIRMYLAQNRTGNEHGGILLGMRKRSSVQVVSATFPQKWDHATPSLFKRSARGHADIAVREWTDSGRTMDWVGEWHSHPPGFPNPSMTDRISWLRITKRTRKPMVFVIFSDPGMYVGAQQPVLKGLVELREKERGENAALYSG
jgi:integrative and conjugative element protein (TIGR02256 family)